MLTVLGCSLLSQQDGYVTMRVLSKVGRLTKQGHVSTIIRNVLGEKMLNKLGRIRMLPAAKGDTQEVRPSPQRPLDVL
jgi:hypothetical protein